MRGIQLDCSSGRTLNLADIKAVMVAEPLDQKEFFAEMTEACFGMNDFFPFNRAELMTAEPKIRVYRVDAG